MAEAHILIIGVGNADRGDDGAGLSAATLLQKQLQHRDDIHVIQRWGESTGLVDAMAGWDMVLIIDAARSGAEPGSYRMFEAGRNALPSDLVDISSHGFGVPQAIELARELATLPKHCHIYAIEGTIFDAGAPLSNAVREAVGIVVQDIMKSLDRSLRKAAGRGPSPE